MTLDVRLRPEAERDLGEAASWYEARQIGLGHRFLDEVQAILDTIADTPEIYPIVHRDVRRALIRHFPFGVYYSVEGDGIVVVAVMHASRHPLRWMERG